MKRTTFRSIVLLAVAGVFVMLASHCKKSDSSSSQQLPAVTTTAPGVITQTAAHAGGNVTSDGGSGVTAKGVCWSQHASPTLSDQKTSDGTGTGNFSSLLTGLTPNTAYYLRAYATNSSGTAYGSELSFVSPHSMTDIDGNSYQTVQIGTQVWMMENLNVTSYRNGDPIPNEMDDAAWFALTSGAYCDYENLTDSCTIFGKYYNYYAVADPRNLAPVGWHIPTDAEFTTLVNFLGGMYVAGGKLKENSSHWTDANVGATNESGFSARPGGFRIGTGVFQWRALNCEFWSSTVYNSYDTKGLVLYYNDVIAYQNHIPKTYGISVRCIKD
jgi:uncharacterized protein (TIGR02145 family)